MRRTPLLGVAASLCLILGSAGCGGEDKDRSAADIKKDLSANLQDNDPELDKETADCFADVIVDEVGLEKLKDIDLTDDEPASGDDEEIAAAAGRAVQECGLSG